MSWWLELRALNLPVRGKHPCSGGRLSKALRVAITDTTIHESVGTVVIYDCTQRLFVFLPVHSTLSWMVVSVISLSSALLLILADMYSGNSQPLGDTRAHVAVAWKPKAFLHNLHASAHAIELVPQSVPFSTPAHVCNATWRRAECPGGTALRRPPRLEFAPQIYSTFLLHSRPHLPCPPAFPGPLPKIKAPNLALYGLGQHQFTPRQ